MSGALERVMNLSDEELRQDWGLISFGERPYLPGLQAMFRYPNGYGASVVSGYGAYGVELAVIFWAGEAFELVYDTPVTDDVIGWIGSGEELKKILADIRALPPRTAQVEGSSTLQIEGAS